MKQLKPAQAVWLAWRQGPSATWSLGHIVWTDATTLCGREIPHNAGLAPDAITRCSKCQTLLLEKTVGVPNLAPKPAADPKFTPGPWMVAGDTDDHLYVSPLDKALNVICDIIGRETLDRSFPGGYTEEDEANTSLIAAAPDLYDALSELLKNVRSSDKLWSAEDRAMAALAKARGE